jgi:VWFA-related protein
MTTWKSWLSAAAAIFGLQVIGIAQPQPQPLTFRTSAQGVEVDVYVSDGGDAFVQDLTLEDFELLEDGRPQRIQFFSKVDLASDRQERSPLGPRLSPDRRSDVASNTEQPGALYVIVLDSLQVDAHRTPIVKDLARRFIVEHLHPNDQVALVTIGSNASQEFTTSRGTLLESVDQFMGQKMDSPILLALRTGDAPMERDATRSRERAAQAIDSLRALRSLVTALGGVTGRRKAVVLFSEGLDFNTDFLIRQRASQYPGEAVAEGTAGAVLDEQREMIATATRANVPLYTVDPRGLASPAQELIKVGPVVRSDTELLMKGMRVELEREQSRLREFSEQTGGLATVNVNDFDAGFSSIIRDTSSYYLLGYQSPAKPDGNFHRITVRVKRPGVQVRARSGYYAPRSASTVDSNSDPLPALLASPVTISGFPLRVASHVLRGAAGDARVLMTIEVEGSGLPFDERAGAFANTVEISYMALDKSATSRAGAKKTLALSLQPAAKQAIVSGGLRFVTEFTIPEGRYHMRLAARETFRSLAGSVAWDLDATEALRSSLAMSDIILTFSRAAAWPTRLDVAGLQDWLPGPPTAERSFAAQDTVAAFAEIYVSAEPAAVSVEVSVRSPDGRELFAAREALDRARLTADGRYRYVATIPLKEFAAGGYELSMTASASARSESATRSLAFSVR